MKLVVLLFGLFVFAPGAWGDIELNETAFNIEQIIFEKQTLQIISSFGFHDTLIVTEDAAAKAGLSLKDVFDMIRLGRETKDLTVNLLGARERGVFKLDRIQITYD